MTLRRLFIPVLLCAVVTLPASLSAGTIASASASWTGQVCSGLWDNPVPGCNGTITPVGGSTRGTGTTGAGAGFSFPSSLQPYVLGGGVADATVSYGGVSVFASGNIGVVGNGQSCCVPLHIFTADDSTNASFQDTITILGGVGSGTLEATGFVSITIQGDFGPTAEGFAGLVVGSAAANTFLFSHSGFVAFDLMTPFTFGVQFKH